MKVLCGSSVDILISQLSSCRNERDRFCSKQLATLKRLVVVDGERSATGRNTVAIQCDTVYILYSKSPG